MKEQSVLSGKFNAPSTVSEESDRADLAPALRVLRKSSGFTQAALADAAGVSTSFISQLERGSTDVTFSTLTRICTALGTTVGSLFDVPRSDGRVVPFERLRKLDYSGVEKYVMTRTEMEGVDVCMFVFPPASSTGLRHPPGVDRTELWICLTEFLAVDLDGIVSMLRVGDSIDFKSDCINAVYNPGPTETRALLIIKNHTK
jgi:transcriptional regulator with XRE-family HTH domain